ncbi:MAG: hypothetical protein ACREH5_04265 [Candidatus Omnitrophota bacterium]
MPYSFFRRVSTVGVVLAVLAAAALGFFASWPASCGILVGYFWIFLNSYFLFQLLEMSFTPGPKRKNRILFLSVIKFPVLYVAGFFILTTRVFPIYSVLLGLTAFLLAFFALWVRSNPAGKTVEKGAS